MKTRTITITSFLMICFLMLTSMVGQEDTVTFQGVYDGKEDYGYNFIDTDEDGTEYTMTLHQIDEELLKTFDLNSDALVGTKFSVTYKTEVETLKDDEGYEDDIETLTIVALKKM